MKKLTCGETKSGYTFTIITEYEPRKREDRSKLLRILFFIGGNDSTMFRDSFFLENESDNNFHLFVRKKLRETENIKRIATNESSICHETIEYNIGIISKRLEDIISIIMFGFENIEKIEKDYRNKDEEDFFLTNNKLLEKLKGFSFLKDIQSNIFTNEQLF